jgi:hypothetical protein
MADALMASSSTDRLAIPAFARLPQVARQTLMKSNFIPRLEIDKRKLCGTI